MLMLSVSLIGRNGREVGESALADGSLAKAGQR